MLPYFGNFEPQSRRDGREFLQISCFLSRGQSGQPKSQIYTHSESFRPLWKSILLLLVWIHCGIFVLVCISAVGESPKKPLDPIRCSGFIYILILTFISQLTVTIKNDLNMSQDDVANSNIVALLAT